jgi:Transposase
MGKARRKFTDEFKREAMALCRQPGAVVTQIARDPGLEPEREPHEMQINGCITSTPDAEWLRNVLVANKIARRVP